MSTVFRIPPDSGQIARRLALRGPMLVALAIHRIVRTTVISMGMSGLRSVRERHLTMEFATPNCFGMPTCMAKHPLYPRQKPSFRPGVPSKLCFADLDDQRTSR